MERLVLYSLEHGTEQSVGGTRNSLGGDMCRVRQGDRKSEKGLHPSVHAFWVGYAEFELCWGSSRP